MSDGDAAAPIQLSEYCGLLRDNKRFRYLFSGYLITNSGNWINYIAALALIHRLLDDSSGGAAGTAANPGTPGMGSGSSADASSLMELGTSGGNDPSVSGTQASKHSAMLVAAFLFLRMVPALVLAPIIGPIAERVDKRFGMAVCDIMAAVTVGGMLALSIVLDSGRHAMDGYSGAWVWPSFFALVVAQQSFAAQYDPLRKSLVPQVCLGERQLNLATTVDASVWSALMAIGAAIGGVLTTLGSININFAVDAMTYIASAILILAMEPVKRPQDDHADNTSLADQAEIDADANPDAAKGDNSNGTVPPSASVQYAAPMGASLCDSCCFGKTVDAISKAAAATRNASGADETQQPLWPYLYGKPGLLCMLFAKMSGAWTWGLAELLEVELSADRGFQLDGWTPSATLGLVYAATGVGALCGPLVANSCATGSEGSELRSTLIMVVGFAVGVASYAMLFLSIHETDNTGWSNGGRVASLCVAGFLRAISSSLIWVYSTLVVQIKILGPNGGNPWFNPVFGRVFALEMSIFTAGKLGSFVLGGAGIGVFECDHVCACGLLLGIAVVSTGVWGLFIFVALRVRARSSAHPAASASSSSSMREPLIQ